MFGPPGRTFNVAGELYVRILIVNMCIFYYIIPLEYPPDFINELQEYMQANEIECEVITSEEGYSFTVSSSSNSSILENAVAFAAFKYSIHLDNFRCWPKIL